MKFSKYHALGNDYLVITPIEAGDLLENPINIQKICHRNYGIGSDGILVGPYAVPEADFGLRIYNPDGSEAEKSGNGIRIFARWLWDQGLVHSAPFSIHVPGGIVIAQVGKNGKSIEVQMGKVSFDSQLIPVTGPPREVLREIIEVDGNPFLFCAATIGNPHCVILCEQVNTEQVHKIGPLIEHEPRFPNRTNVQFMQILDANHIYIEIWERGAGYTLASGSSSCAAAATAYRLGLCQPILTVQMPGGSLEVQISESGQVLLTGPVTEIAAGELSNEIFSDKI